MEKFIQEYTNQDYAEIAVEKQFQIVLQWSRKLRREVAIIEESEINQWRY